MDSQIKSKSCFGALAGIPIYKDAVFGCFCKGLLQTDSGILAETSTLNLHKIPKAWTLYPKTLTLNVKSTALNPKP